MMCNSDPGLFWVVVAFGLAGVPLALTLWLLLRRTTHRATIALSFMLGGVLAALMWGSADPSSGDKLSLTSALAAAALGALAGSVVSLRLAPQVQLRSTISGAAGGAALPGGALLTFVAYAVFAGWFADGLCWN